MAVKSVDRSEVLRSKKGFQRSRKKYASTYIYKFAKQLEKEDHTRKKNKHKKKLTCTQVFEEDNITIYMNMYTHTFTRTEI